MRSHRSTLLVWLALSAGAWSALAQSPFNEMGGANRYSVSPQDRAAQAEARGQRHLAKARELAAKAEAEGDALAAGKAAQEYDRARKAFEEALGKDPGLAPAHLGLGEVALEQGLWGGAVRSCQTAMQLTEEDPRARACLLEALLNLGDLGTAEVLCRTTATTVPRALGALAEVLERWSRADGPGPSEEEMAAWLEPPALEAKEEEER